MSVEALCSPSKRREVASAEVAAQEVAAAALDDVPAEAEPDARRS